MLVNEYIFQFSYFSKHEGFLVVDGVEAVGGDDLCFVLAPDGVRRQPVHVHLDVCPHLPVRQKLTGNNLKIFI